MPEKNLKSEANLIKLIRNQKDQSSRLDKKSPPALSSLPVIQEEQNTGMLLKREVAIKRGRKYRPSLDVQKSHNYSSKLINVSAMVRPPRVKPVEKLIQIRSADCYSQKV